MSRKYRENKPWGLYFSKAFFEGLIFGGAYLRREILRFKTDWVSLIVGSKFTVFALFYFGFFALPVWGPNIFGGAYTWKGLFSEFYGI